MRRLDSGGERNALRARHRAYFLQLAQRSADGWCGPGQEATLARLHADHAATCGAAFDHRVAHIELDGEPTRALNNLTRGFAHLPVRTS